jgi:hypothetical protein
MNRILAALFASVSVAALAQTGELDKVTVELK